MVVHSPLQENILTDMCFCCVPWVETIDLVPSEAQVTNMFTEMGRKLLIFYCPSSGQNSTESLPSLPVSSLKLREILNVSF